MVKEVIIRGVLLLQSGVTPSIIESNLQAYLAPKLRKIAIAREAAARAEPTGEGSGPTGGETPGT